MQLLLHKRIRIAFIAIILSLTFHTPSTFAQQSNIEDMSCYVVVGAFKLETNAKRFSEYLTTQSLEAQFRKNTHRNLYYVFTYTSKVREAAKEELFKIRADYPNLTEAWLYAGDFSGPHIPSDQWEAIASPSVARDADAEQASNLQEPEVIEAAIEEEPINNPIVENTAPEPKTSSILLKDNESLIYINAYNATTHKEVIGGFKLWDAERNKEIKELNSHELQVIKHPSNASNKIKLSSNVFGFREIEQVIDLDEPLNETNGIVETIGDTILVNFDMARYNKGDVMTLWQVFFYIDAAIMKEESIPQLNQLYAMMKENDKVKVKIHGHTNGNSKGKVLHLDMDDKNFFSLNGTHEEAFASAKQLSLYRAYTIQHWLIDQGIAEERMDIEGWGGKKMIHDKHDPKAHENVRVEIEIIEE